MNKYFAFLIFTQIVVFGCKSTQKNDQVQIQNRANSRATVSVQSSEPIQEILILNQEMEEGKFQLNQVETIRFDLNSDLKPDEIQVFKTKEDIQEPGDFHKIVIKYSNGNIFTAYDRGNWIKLSPDKKKSIKSLINSDFLAVQQLDKQRFLIVIDGWAYASSPGTITTFVADSHIVSLALQQQIDLQEIQDIDGDGMNEIIGFTEFSQVGDPNPDPMPIKAFQYQNGKFVINKDLTQKYYQKITKK